MIVETTDNRFFRVRETGDPDLTHTWLGVEVSRAPSKSVTFPEPLYLAKTTRETLVRKAGCRVIVRS